MIPYIEPSRMGARTRRVRRPLGEGEVEVRRDDLFELSGRRKVPDRTLPRETSAAQHYRPHRLPHSPEPEPL